MSMIIGVDIGGTKTFLATLSENGEIVEHVRFETSRDYDTFLQHFEEAIKEINIPSNVEVCCAAVPGLLDRQNGTVEALGNLPWRNKRIADDISKILGGISVVIENDSKLAGLAEARQLTESSRALYLTISTGIGAALVVDGHLSEDVIDMEAGKMPLPKDGDSKIWESFASGKAFMQRYGKRGEEVNDPKIWESFASDIGDGLVVLCSIFQLDAVIFGGGFGQYADNFIPYLQPRIENLHPIIEKPKNLVAAKYGDLSVIYGCYEYAKDHLPA